MSALIPFAKDCESGELRDVEEVPRGRACNCVCPSCGQSVVAKRSEVRVWHFAHDSRAEVESTRDCDLSFEVVCAQMLRQILIGSRNTTFALPAYTKFVSRERGINVCSKYVEITEGSTPRVDSFNEIYGPYTLLAMIGNTGLLVDIVYSDRLIMALESYPAEIAGHVSLDVTEYTDLYAGNKVRGKSFKAVMQSWLFNKVNAKKWIYHAREPKKLESIGQDLERELDQKVASKAREDRFEFEVGERLGGADGSWKNSDRTVTNRENVSSHVSRPLPREPKMVGERRKVLDASDIGDLKCCLQCKRQFVTRSCPYCYPS